MMAPLGLGMKRLYCSSWVLENNNIIIDLVSNTMDKGRDC